jgi:hypothetical protein
MPVTIWQLLRRPSLKQRILSEATRANDLKEREVVAKEREAAALEKLADKRPGKK